MGKSVTVKLCSLCEAPIEYNNPGGAKHPTIDTFGKNGLVIEMGYSVGGWGYRQNAISFSEEVCDDCFKAAQTVYDAIEQFMEDRTGRKGDSVRTVWSNESSPKRRGASILRALP